MKLTFWDDYAPTRIAIAGDWHADTDYAVEAIRWAERRDVEGILHLGDFGIEYSLDGEDYLEAITTALTEADMWLAFIDGNHEDHLHLASYPLEATGARRVTKRVMHLPRGFRWRWRERSWLALGGATSLDKARRIPMVDWWHEEAITMREAEAASEPGLVDYMLTHDAPERVDVPGLSDNWPYAALKAAGEHRALLQAVVDVVQPTRLWHGHMHVRHTAGMRTDRGMCRVDGLDCNHAPLPENMMVLDLDAEGNVA